MRMVLMFVAAGVLLWLGAMSMTFASTGAGVIMALLGLGIAYVAVELDARSLLA